MDPEPRIRALAELFFHELAKKEVKGTSPIYNLLPDILSNLSADSRLGKADFQSIMQAVSNGGRRGHWRVLCGKSADSL